MNKARRLNRVLAALFNNVLKAEEAVVKKARAYNLTVTEVHTLEAIGKDGAKTMTFVADILKINVSTLTAAINKLVTKGYVNRFGIPEDRRIVMVELTETGIRAVRQHEAFRLILLRNALSKLTPEETERLIGSLENVNEFMLGRLDKRKQDQ